MSYSKKLSEYLLITNKGDDSISELSILYPRREDFDEVYYIHVVILAQDEQKYHILDIPKTVSVIKFLVDTYDIYIVSNNIEQKNVNVIDIINHFKEREV